MSRISSGKFCIGRFPIPLLVIMLLSDAGLNSLLAYMFYRPLAILESGNLRIDENDIKRSSKIQSVMKETWICSAVALTLDFTCVLLTAMPTLLGKRDTYNYFM